MTRLTWGDGVGADVVRHAVEVLEDAGDEDLLNAGGAGELLDGVVEFGEEGVAEMAEVVGAGLGGLLGETGGAGLPEDAGDARGDGDEKERGEGQSEAVASGELEGVIAEVAFAGEDGLMIEEGLDVCGELLGGLIALVGFFAKGLAEDGFEVGVGEGGVGGCGAVWGPLADDVDHLFGGEVVELVGEAAGEHLVEQDAERVGVAGGGDGAAEDLFGAGVFGGEGEEAFAGEAAGFEGVIAGDEAGGAEVEEMGDAVFADEDVVGLEVAMDDEVLVGELDGGADGEEEAEFFLEGEVMGSTIFVDADAVDVIHDEEKDAVVADAAVEEAGDVGVVEGGEDLALLAEALEESFGGKGQVDDLDGDLFFVLAVGAVREIDGAHAAAAEERFDFVWAKAAEGDGGCGGGVLAAFAGFLLADMGGEDGGDAVAKVGIGATLFAQEGFTLLWRESEGLVEELLEQEEVFVGRIGRQLRGQRHLLRGKLCVVLYRVERGESASGVEGFRGGGVRVEALEEPGLDEAELAVDRRFGDAEEGSGFFGGAAEEVAEFDEADLVGLDGLELLKGAVELKEFGAADFDPGHGLVKWDGLEAGAAGLGLLAAGVVDEDHAHGARGEDVEVAAVFPGDFLLLQEFEVELVNEDGGLHEALAFFAAHVRCGDLAKLRVDEGDELVERVGLTSFPPAQKDGDLCHGNSVSFGTSALGIRLRVR